MTCQRPPLEVITIGQPSPKAIRNFVEDCATLVVHVARRWLAEGKAEIVPMPDGSKMLVRAGTEKATG